MPLKLTIAFNTLVQIIGKFASAALTLLITILLARTYGSSGFGDFIKMITFIGLFYLISDFGINAIYLKEEQKGKAKFTSLLFLRGLWSMMLMFAAMILLVFLPYNPLSNQGFTPIVKLGIIILVPSILFQAVFTSCNAIFQKNLRYDKSVIAQVLSTGIALVLIIISTFLHLPLMFAMVSYLISSLSLAILSFFLVQQYISKISITEELLIINHLPVWKRLFSQSLPLGIVLICNLIYFRADIFILSYFRTTSEVGVYGLAYKFFDFLLTIPIFFANSIYPILIRANGQPASPSGRQQTVNRIIKKSSLFLLVLSLLLTISGLLLAPFISLIKYDFTLSILPFRILLLGLPFFFVSSLFMWAIIALGAQRKLFSIYLMGMVVNILLNLIFIPSFGYNAAAVITVVSELGVLLLLIGQYRRLIYS